MSVLFSFWINLREKKAFSLSFLLLSFTKKQTILKQICSQFCGMVWTSFEPVFIC